MQDKTLGATITATARQQHQKEVAAAQEQLQTFIAMLEQLPYQEGTYTLSMDLYAAFQASSSVDLPEGFQLEFGRQVNKAIRDGRLPFKRKTVTRASLAAYGGLDPLTLPEVMGREC